MVSAFILRKDWPELALILDKTLAVMPGAAKRTLFVRGVMNASPPMDYVDNQGKTTGLGAKFVEALSKRMGGVLTLRSASWTEIYTAVKEQRMDALVCCQ